MKSITPGALLTLCVFKQSSDCLILGLQRRCLVHFAGAFASLGCFMQTQIETAQLWITGFIARFYFGQALKNLKILPASCVEHRRILRKLNKDHIFLALLAGFEVLFMPSTVSNDQGVPCQQARLT